ncbi:N-acetylmuramoyl-L-alanine amidase family protein [Paenibacillus methanolicus]|uniref:N-acetylmuramoyl-L-alanine amidase n=1 Tax=Paenibacillus methanolicus TaxID=582686 RepID=A0A5S5C333_9BACL|nr:N-acetylmuramoyl-L-alanine amidase [Paenibacillus methanolicus]TYP73734.1 N-acetylmuramoyl-L-alanine amidase [Paenibacillus methanolicus]
MRIHANHRLPILARAASLFCLLVMLSPAPASADDPIPGPDYKRALPAAEVLIDVGHGGIDGGTVYNGLLEKDINLAVGKKLYLLLRSNGIRAVMNRDGDYALSDDNRWHGSRSRHQRDLSQRTELSRELDTTLVVSLHVNWADDRSASGPLVLHQREGQSALLAGFIQHALNVRQDASAMPRIGKPYFLLKTIREPAVIVEMGFMSNARDRALLTNPRTQLQIADAIASGVRNYILFR